MRQEQKQQKQERVEFRASPQELKQFEKAASYYGMSLSAFLRMAASQKAAEAVECLKRSDSLILSDRDRDIFLEALENPPEANEYLKKALAEYKRVHG